MERGFEIIIREALELTPRQRLELAGILLASADGEVECGSQEAWDDEIHARIRAIDQGREIGVSFEALMASADKIIKP